MRSLVYEPGVAGANPINLSGAEYTVGQAVGVRSSAPTYTLSAYGITGVTSRAREIQLTVSARTPQLFDRPLAIFDAELESGKPGRLVVDGVWWQSCYVTKHSTTTASTAVDAPSTQQWTVVLLDGAWLRYGDAVSFSPRLSSGDGLDMGVDLAPVGGGHLKATALQIFGLPKGAIGSERYYQLIPVFTPSDAADQHVSWASDNPAVASVSPLGMLTLTGSDGFVLITCTAQDGSGVYDSRSLHVTYDADGYGTVEWLEHAAWPSKDFYSGDKNASHIDSDDPSILDVGVVPSAYEYGAARSTLSDLQANHRYEIRFETRYAPGSKHVSGDMCVGVNKAGVIMWSARLDLSKVTDDWVEHTVKFGPVDADQATGITQLVTVKPDGNDSAAVQLRDFRLIDVTSQVGEVDDSVDPWIVPWDQLGYAGDHVDLSVSAGSYASQWSTDKTPIAAGHTYALTLTAQGTGGTLSLHLRDQWDIGAAFTATGSTETYTAQFTAANDARSMQDVCLYLDGATSDARWTVYGLRLEDLTASNGAAGGSVEHAGLTFTAANWGGKPDASDPTILDVAVPTKTGIFYSMPYPVDADTRYHVSFLIRLTGGEPHDGRFWLAFNGAKLWSPTTISLADLSGEWQYCEFTFTVPDGDFADSSLILNAFEATTAEGVQIQISRLQINKLVEGGN